MIVAAFSNIFISGKILPHAKTSYLVTFSVDKAKILAVYLSKLY